MVLNAELKSMNKFRVNKSLFSRYSDTEFMPDATVFSVGLP